MYTDYEIVCMVSQPVFIHVTAQPFATPATLPVESQLEVGLTSS